MLCTPSMKMITDYEVKLQKNSKNSDKLNFYKQIHWPQLLDQTCLTHCFEHARSYTSSVLSVCGSVLLNNFNSPDIFLE